MLAWACEWLEPRGSTGCLNTPRSRQLSLSASGRILAERLRFAQPKFADSELGTRVHPGRPLSVHGNRDRSQAGRWLPQSNRRLRVEDRRLSARGDWPLSDRLPAPHPRRESAGLARLSDRHGRDRADCHPPSLAGALAGVREAVRTEARPGWEPRSERVGPARGYTGVETLGARLGPQLTPPRLIKRWRRRSSTPRGSAAARGSRHSRRGGLAGPSLPRCGHTETPTALKLSLAPRDPCRKRYSITICFRYTLPPSSGADDAETHHPREQAPPRRAVRPS